MAVTHDDLVQMWGEANVRTFPVEHLEGLGLPGSAREGLGQLGIPDHVDVLFDATFLEETQLKGVGDTIRIGHSWHEEYNICIALSDGRIYASHRFHREVTFVNSDLPKYLEFLLRVARMYQMFDQAAEGAVDEAGYLDQVAETQQAAEQLDPDALMEGAWWTGVIEELKLV
jgi:hypothetical protein